MFEMNDRKILYRICLCAGLVAFAVFSGGCSRDVSGLDEGDFRDPLLRKAQSRIREGDKDGAMVSLQKALERQPDLAQADLELALLYDDYKKDYVSAIYHYQRYLDLRPRTQKRVLIEDLVRKAKMSFAASVSDQYPEVARKLQALEEENVRLKASLRELRENLASVQAGGMKTEKTSKTAGDGNAVKPAAVQASAVCPTGEVYCVQEGDTLSRIATKVYNNPRKWKVILDANSDVLSSPSRLRKGQTLKIPR